MMELGKSKILFAYFDLERYVFVVQVGSNRYRGPYNEEEYFEPEFEANGYSLYYLFPLLEGQIKSKRDESEEIVQFYQADNQKKIGKYLQEIIATKNRVRRDSFHTLGRGVYGTIYFK